MTLTNSYTSSHHRPRPLVLGCSDICLNWWASGQKQIAIMITVAVYTDRVYRCVFSFLHLLTTGQMEFDRSV